MSGFSGVVTGCDGRPLGAGSAADGDLGASAGAGVAALLPIVHDGPRPLPAPSAHLTRHVPRRRRVIERSPLSLQEV